VASRRRAGGFVANWLKSPDYPETVRRDKSSGPFGFRNFFKRFFAAVAYNALFGLHVGLFPDFAVFRAENDPAVFIENPYSVNTGAAAQGVHGVRDVLTAIEKHALPHGSQKELVRAYGFHCDAPSFRPYDERRQGDEHDGAYQQKEAKESEGERIGNISHV
jgi:hypothetical protein